MTNPTPKPGILDISPYVAGKSKAASAARIIKLSSNENPLGPSPKALEAYQAAATSLNRYPDSSVLALREAIGDVYDIAPERIICGAGSDEVIGLLIHAYAGVGDEVLYSEHGFLMYKIYTQGNGATPVTAAEENLTASVDNLLAKVTPRTRIVFLANPNNPTGSYIPAESLRRLRRELRDDIILAIDDAYCEYMDEDDYITGRELVDEGTNSIMLRTFSKIYGLSALRLGWAYGPAHMIDVLNRTRGPFNVSMPAIVAGIAAVRDEEYTERAREHNTRWRAWLTKELSKLGLHVYPSFANFLLVRFGSTSGQTAADANQHLMAQGIIPREVTNYGLPDCLRISIGTEQDNMALIDALRSFAKKAA